LASLEILVLMVFLVYHAQEVQVVLEAHQHLAALAFLEDLEAQDQDLTFPLLAFLDPEVQALEVHSMDHFVVLCLVGLVHQDLYCRYLLACQFHLWNPFLLELPCHDENWE
jgi:hypothetical protein